MDEINFTKLIKIVETSTKKNFQARLSEGKLVPNVANLGAKIGDIAKLERSGEYNGIAVQFMENTKPLLTDHFVIRILKMLKSENYTTPLDILGLNSLDQLRYVLDMWFKKAIAVPSLESNPEYENFFNSEKIYPALDNWITSVAHDPLLTKIKIVEVGQNEKTGNSVVPVDWIDRVFVNGQDLHKEMNKIETRIGKPPVTFAIIYSMRIQKQDTIIKNINDANYDNIFYLIWTGSKFYSEMTKIKRHGFQYVKYGTTFVGFKLNDILEPKTKTNFDKNRIKEVGLLVSRLQKAIRRGRYGSKALIETIEKLNESPNYNLPEHGFLRVSASKQLVWRLFISTLEDCRPYQAINEISLLNLLLLTLITQKVQEYKFTKPVLEAIKLTAILVQYNDISSDWYRWKDLPLSKKTPLKNNNSDFHNAISLALEHLIMMSGDNKMLRRYYSIHTETLFEPYIYPNGIETINDLILVKSIDHDNETYQDIILSSYDMHVKTHIILYYQACIPISMTTKQISEYIWNISSSYNVRSGKEIPEPDPILRSIQKFFSEESKNKKTTDKQIILRKSKEHQDINYNVVIDDHTKRISFLLLFGKTYKSNNRDVIIAGTKDLPLRIKNKNEWITITDEKEIKKNLNDYSKKVINLSGIDAPFGFKWKKKIFTTQISNENYPVLDGKKINFFDGSSAIEPITPVIKNNIGKKMYQFIVALLTGLDINFDVLLDLKMKKSKTHSWINNYSHNTILNWKPHSVDILNMNMDLIKLAYTKIFNQINNIIMIGPVSRSGQKMQNSINYLLEGKLWAVFILLSFMYPSTIKQNGSLNYIINKETPGYVHLINTFNKILFTKKKINGIIPSIKTILWDHQIESVNKIIAGFRKGIYGFGDASQVGSGKTLTALKIATELISENDDVYSGILVLLPGNKLLKTWKDELNKHTEGFDVIFQGNNVDVGPIKRNTIVVTTMARNRDHSINHNWLLLVIDECLTVQNKNALWTESAWMQSIMSKHLIMMSATFFRARFDKLYYMLKMLKTGLPEKKEYLNTILLESIVSQISKISRKWTSNVNYFVLDDITRKKYEEIEKSELSTESKFAKLTSLLVNSKTANETVTKQLSKLVFNLEKRGHKCLIYAKANNEAELWSKNLKIPIYPKKGKHCIVTYHNGTYGLNDLIIYDTIIMRPPAPDKLPQIKGRLDRHGQKNDRLHIEYFVLKETIEMGLILRMNIASQFIHKYIMPLAKFYDISVHHEKYLKDNSE